MLSAENLYRFYHSGDEETLALRGVSIAVDFGEVVAVTGPSGSGKSTLLACLAGLDEPDGGVVSVSGERISRRSEERRADIRSRLIGVLLQHGNLIGHLSVEENVALAQRLSARGDSLPPAEILQDCEILGRRRARPAELSGGELARAGLAVALANSPAVLIADEPTGELDSATAAEISDLLRQRARSGTAVLIVTHSAEVGEAADRRLRLIDGVIQ